MARHGERLPAAVVEAVLVPRAAQVVVGDGRPPGPAQLHGGPRVPVSSRWSTPGGCHRRSTRLRPTGVRVTSNGPLPSPTPRSRAGAVGVGHLQVALEVHRPGPKQVASGSRGEEQGGVSAWPRSAASGPASKRTASAARGDAAGAHARPACRPGRSRARRACVAAAERQSVTPSGVRSAFTGSSTMTLARRHHQGPSAVPHDRCRVARPPATAGDLAPVAEPPAGGDGEAGLLPPAARAPPLRGGRPSTVPVTRTWLASRGAVLRCWSIRGRR